MNSTSMKICPCWNCKGAFVSRSTYFRHRNRFYSSKEKVWIRPDPKSVQRLVLDESSDEEITISKKSKVSCNDEEDVTTPLDTEQIYTAILAEESSSESEVEDIMMGETTKVEVRI